MISEAPARRTNLFSCMVTYGNHKNKRIPIKCKTFLFEESAALLKLRRAGKPAKSPDILILQGNAVFITSLLHLAKWVDCFLRGRV